MLKRSITQELICNSLLIIPTTHLMFNKSFIVFSFSVASFECEILIEVLFSALSCSKAEIALKQISPFTMFACQVEQKCCWVRLGVGKCRCNVNTRFALFGSVSIHSTSVCRAWLINERWIVKSIAFECACTRVYQWGTTLCNIRLLSL